MYEWRLKFEKTGRASYISHLDLMRTMQRAFARARIGLRYSEGFNPHAVLSILLPLSVGTQSRCELMDFSLATGGETPAPEEMVNRLNEALPEGIRALEVYGGGLKVAKLKWLRVAGVLTYDEKDASEMLGPVKNLFAAPEIPVLRKTKRGEELTNLAGAMNGFEARAEGDKLHIEAVVSVFEPVINPLLLVDAIMRGAPEAEPDFASFTRIGLYTENMEAFR